MQMQQMFDARSVEPSTGGGPIVPEGEFKAVITKSEPTATKDNNGGMLVLTTTIIEGQYQGKELPYRLNLCNQSQQAVEIAYKQLSAICHVTGVYQIQNTEQLHNIPFINVVKHRDGYANIVAVKFADGSSLGKDGARQAPAERAPISGGNGSAPAAPTPWGASGAAPA